MQNVIINADDYAMDREVDAAIITLAGRGIVTAASAMVLSPYWPEAGRGLKDVPLSAGLHLDFTSPFARDSLLSDTLPRLILRSHARQLDHALVRRAIEHQLSAFESTVGHVPHFVDGHQHVHQLPVVRDVLLDVLSDRYGSAARNVGLRDCVPRRWRGIKAAIIARTGGKGLSRRARERGHYRNTDFAGVYDFAPCANLAALWEGWLNPLEGALPLVMVHVAVKSSEADERDPIREARYREFDWLTSEEFQALRLRYSLNLVRWPPAAHAAHWETPGSAAKAYP